ncbi:MAG: hypothetical protein WC788_01805 [Candidatus Paceibacterota bacterium]
MLKIEKKKDANLFKGLSNLFEKYVKGAKNGKYYIFLPNDILAEKVDAGSRETAMSLEDGLSQLGKAVYFAATGFWEYNDPSIKIDGYPPIESMTWPVLEMMLSKDKKVEIEKIGRKIKEINRKINEIEEDKKKVESIPVIKINDIRSDISFDRSLVQGCTVMDSGAILGLVIKNANAHEEALGIGIYKWVWVSAQKDRTLYKMIPDNARLIEMLEKTGFLIEKSQIPEIIEKWDRIIIYSDKKSFIYGLEKLKTELSGKKIMSILDKKGNWYLKVV